MYRTRPPPPRRPPDPYPIPNPEIATFSFRAAHRGAPRRKPAPVRRAFSLYELTPTCTILYYMMDSLNIPLSALVPRFPTHFQVAHRGATQFRCGATQFRRGAPFSL